MWYLGTTKTDLKEQEVRIVIVPVSADGSVAAVPDQGQVGLVAGRSAAHCNNRDLIYLGIESEGGFANNGLWCGDH